MVMEKIKRQIKDLADECLEAGKQERPENLWLREMYERFRKEAGGSGKAETDALIYYRMYGKNPGKSSDTLKIRYWRTGRHFPSGRETCTEFGKALNLAEAEQKYLMQAYFDRSDCVFKEESEQELYITRRNVMDELVKEYLDKVHPALKLRLYRFGEDMDHCLRHLYYTDAKRYLKNCPIEKIEVERHITSISYESEFSRQIKLLGEIPRKTMIRHLLLFGMPFLNRELMSQRLEILGYLPLLKDHTQVTGSRLDQLLLGFLEIYEKSCTGKEPLECLRWFRQSYSFLDGYLEKNNNTELRFLYFKALRDNR